MLVVASLLWAAIGGTTDDALGAVAAGAGLTLLCLGVAAAISRWHRRQDRPLALRAIPPLTWIVVDLSLRAGLAAPPTVMYRPSAARTLTWHQQSGRDALILSDGLLRRLTWRTLAAVIAQAISHRRRQDGPLFALQRGLWAATALLAVGYAVASGSGWLLLSPWLLHWSQSRLLDGCRFAADQDAMGLTGDPRGLVLALMARQDDGVRLRGRLWRVVNRLPTYAPSTDYFETADLPLYWLPARRPLIPPLPGEPCT